MAEVPSHPLTGRPKAREHVERIRTTRQENARVRAYLDALDRRDDAALAKRLGALRSKAAAVEVDLAQTGDPLDRLRLAQEQLDLAQAIADAEYEETLAADFTRVEAEFVEVLPAFAERTGITRKAFRSMGVPAKVLHGIR